MKKIDTPLKRELLIGCGNDRKKHLVLEGHTDSWDNLTTLDMDKTCSPDVVHDLEVLPLPFDDNTFDEIHAYEVLEHCGSQGDWKFFFDQFTEFHRILKPNGLFIGSVPTAESPWAFGDPGHKRIFAPGLLVFLDQEEYAKQVGNGHMADYRSYYSADFKRLGVQSTPLQVLFALQARKGRVITV
jgi:SAM-dependent methyltransferase